MPMTVINFCTALRVRSLRRSSLDAAPKMQPKAIRPIPVKIRIPVLFRGGAIRVRAKFAG